MPGGGAAAGDSAPALLHPGAQRLERHGRAAGSHMQGHPQPAEGSSMGGTGQAAVALDVEDEAALPDMSLKNPSP